MALGRPAKGLPRYYMDVGWYQHPRFVGLPIEALFVFEASVGYCTKHGTNGALPAHPEDLAAVLGLRISVVRKALRGLIEREALEPTADGLMIRGWADHNPTAEEVEEHTQTKSGAGTYGNHVRWHEKRGQIDADCQWCPTPNGTSTDTDPDPPPDIAEDPKSDRTCDPNPIANPSLGMGWDGMGTEEPSSSDELTTPEASLDDDDPPPAAGPPADQPKPDPLIETALAILADRDLAERQAADHLEPIGDPVAWANSAADRRSERQIGDLRRLADANPGITPEQLADLLEPAPTPGSTPTGERIDRTYDEQQRALLARAEAGMAHARQLAEQEPDPDLNKRGLGDARAAMRRPPGPGDTP